MTIIHGSYLDNLDAVPDGGADFIIIDPPYETTNIKFDKSKFDFEALYSHVKQKLKSNGWLFAFLPIERYGQLSEYFKLKFPYVWVKDTPIPNHDGKLPLMQHESICAFIHHDLKRMRDLYMNKKELRTSGEPYMIKRHPSSTEFSKAQSQTSSNVTVNAGHREGISVLYYNKKSMNNKKWEMTTHPTQKPRELYEMLIKGYCPPGGLVYDPCAGSGTAALAAKRTERQFVCIEKNEGYYKIMRARLESMIY